MPRRINAKRANRPNPREDRNQPKEYDKESISIDKKIKLIPKNVAQENYIEALQDESKTVVIAVGPAGTGKTYLSVLHCIKQLQEGLINKIIVIRPVVTTDGSNLGALPGNIIDKLSPYVGEVISILKEFLGVKKVLKLLEEEIIEILPLALARGRSLKNSGIIVEECQNIEEHLTKVLLSRIAEGSRMYINGDIEQTDKHFNGLKNLIERLENKGGSDHFAICHFRKQDVERHPVVYEVLRIYE